MHFQNPLVKISVPIGSLKIKKKLKYLFLLVHWKLKKKLGLLFTIFFSYQIEQETDLRHPQGHAWPLNSPKLQTLWIAEITHS